MLNFCRLHTKIDGNEDNRRSVEVDDTKSILQSGNFTRFDLFGKHEPEKDEISLVDDDNMEVDNGNENIKNSENSNHADNTKDAEIDSSNIKNATGDPYLNDADDTNKSSHKILKTLTAFEKTEPEITDYDYNIYQNTYI